MDINKVKEVFSDQEFVEKLLQTEEPEDAQQLLEENGIVLTLDEIKQLGDYLEKAANGEIPQEKIEAAANGELTEEELEGVAGGELITFIVGGLIILGAAGVAGSAAYGTYKLATMDAVSSFFRRIRW